jgi:UDP-N-acetylglucosamine acyltransferase
MSNIHPTAVVHQDAKISSTCKIGPFCIVEENVCLDDNVELVSHVHISGRTRIGQNTIIYPFTSIGFAPQDLKYCHEDSEVIIGEGNVIREHVTVHRGTQGGGMCTKIGDHCLLMVGAHIAHDCVVDNHVIMANNATLGGHVMVGEYAIIGGLAAIHQFVRIGKHSIIGGLSGVERDVIPYGSVVGKRARLVGLNLVGMQRREFAREEINAIRAAYSVLFSNKQSEKKVDSKVFKVKVSTISSEERFRGKQTILELIKFLNEESVRSTCMPDRSVDEEEDM